MYVPTLLRIWKKDVWSDSMIFNLDIVITENAHVEISNSDSTIFNLVLVITEKVCANISKYEESTFSLARGYGVVMYYEL